MHVSFQSDHVQYIYILIGMRRVGKTTLGRHVSSLLPRCQFLDMDDYFSRQTGANLAAFVELHGWSVFRSLEVQYMEAVVQHVTAQRDARPWIIATGGGVLETEKGRSLFARLLDWNAAHAACKIYIVHLQRMDMEQFVQEMDDATDASSARPPLEEPLLAVWQQRKAHYRRCSHFDFYLLRDAEPSHGSCAGIEHAAESGALACSCRAFMHFVQRIADRQYIHGKQNYCLSLTSTDMLSPSTLHGIDLVEFRADVLLHEPLDVCAALAEFREQRLRDPELPILFTVRSAQQGGASNWTLSTVQSVLSAAVRLGVEYVDVEMATLIDAAAAEDSAMDTLIREAIRSDTRVVLSYHELKASGFGEAWQDIHRRMRAVQSKWRAPFILKLVSTCSQSDDLAQWRRWVGSLNPATQTSALITHLMGADHEAPLSRVENSLTAPIVFLTANAAGHSRARPAAAGQYSIQSLHAAQIQQGHRPSLQSFYLFGYPVRSSPSPALHSAGFRALGLPYSYSAVEAESLTPLLLERVQADDFGGASVTMPLKQDIGQLVRALWSVNEGSIGALNTLIVERHSRRLLGANTDWIALYSCLLARIRAIRLEQLVHGDAACLSMRTLILGAGATCRSSLFALKRLFGKEDGEAGSEASIWIWNRTLSKAKVLASEFRVQVLETLDLAALSASSPSVFILVNTLPPVAQAEIQWPAVDGLFKGSHALLADYSYVRGGETPFASFYRHLDNSHMICGAELLLEQALYQFHYWTERRSPRLPMAQAMWQAIQ